MNVKKMMGFGLVALPFVALALSMIQTIGPVGMLVVFGGVVCVVGLISVGVNLMHSTVEK